MAANTFEFDSRLLRTATALAGDGRRVTVLGLAAPGLPAEDEVAPGIRLRRLAVDRRVTAAFRPLPARVRRVLARLLGFDPEAAQLPPVAASGPDRLRAPLRRIVEVVAHARRVGPWASAVTAATPDADVYHAKALVALPVIRRAAAQRNARFVYDVADLHTEAARIARMPGPVRRLLGRREAAWMRDAAGVTAVSDAVARYVEAQYGIRRPQVLLNTPSAWRPEDLSPPRSQRLRDALGIDRARPIILYQGGFSVDRGLEELVRAADLEPLRRLDVCVVFLGYGRLAGFLRAAAARAPGRIHVLDAVPPGELLEWTASADLGFVGQPPRTLNQRLNLANKLFESLMAGLPVLVAERSEHCRIVERERLGRCCDVDSPESIAATAAAMLGAPPDQRAALRAHVRRVALERYSWEHQQSGLLGLYRELASGAR